MLCLFFFFTSQFFLPYSVTHDCILDVITDREFNKLLRNSKLLVLYVSVPETSFLENEEFVFASLPTIFESIVTFATITANSAPKIYNSLKSGFSSIHVFKLGQPVNNFIFPESESELIGTITFLVGGANTIQHSKDDLYSALGDAAFSIISTSEKQLEVQHRIAQLSPYFGTINAILCTIDVIKELGLSGNKLILYRKSDKQVVEFDPIDDANIDKAFRPTYFPTMKADQLVQTTGLVALLLVDGKHSKQFKDWVYRFSNTHIDITFGIIQKSQAAPLLKLISNSVPYYPYFIIISYSEAIYYDPSSYISEGTLSSEKMEQYIAAVQSKRIPPSFSSEPIPGEQLIPDITKVVGLTHDEFVNDPNHDIVLFYCLKQFDQALLLMKKYNQYIQESHLNTIKIGYIDVEKNSALHGFPILMSDTHIQVYPAHNKLANCSMVGSQSLYTFVKFITKHTSSRLVENEALFDPDDEMGYLIYYVMEYDNFVKSAQPLLQEYIEEMGFKLGLGSNAQEVIHNVYKQQGLSFANEKFGKLSRKKF